MLVAMQYDGDVDDDDDDDEDKLVGKGETNMLL